MFYFHIDKVTNIMLYLSIVEFHIDLPCVFYSRLRKRLTRVLR